MEIAVVSIWTWFSPATGHFPFAMPPLLWRHSGPTQWALRAYSGCARESDRIKYTGNETASSRQVATEKKYLNSKCYYTIFANESLWPFFLGLWIYPHSIYYNAARLGVIYQAVYWINIIDHGLYQSQLLSCEPDRRIRWLRKKPQYSISRGLVSPTLGENATGRAGL